MRYSGSWQPVFVWGWCCTEDREEKSKTSHTLPKTRKINRSPLFKTILKTLSWREVRKWIFWMWILNSLLWKHPVKESCQNQREGMPWKSLENETQVPLRVTANTHLQQPPHLWPHSAAVCLLSGNLVRQVNSLHTRPAGPDSLRTDLHGHVWAVSCYRRSTSCLLNILSNILKRK